MGGGPVAEVAAGQLPVGGVVGRRLGPGNALRAFCRAQPEVVGLNLGVGIARVAHLRDRLR